MDVRLAPVDGQAHCQGARSKKDFMILNFPPVHPKIATDIMSKSPAQFAKSPKLITY